MEVGRLGGGGKARWRWEGWLEVGGAGWRWEG